jgi:hypothetical protein
MTQGAHLDTTTSRATLPPERRLSSPQRNSTLAGARIGKTRWFHFDVAAGWKARAPREGEKKHLTGGGSLVMLTA